MFRPASLCPVILAGSVALTACASQSDLPNEVLRPQVAVERVDGGLRLTNNTDGRVAYGVLEREFSRQSAAPCPHCPCADCRLDPGDSVVVPYAAIRGYTSGAAEAVVAWWRVAAQGLEFIDTVIVRL